MLSAAVAWWCASRALDKGYNPVLWGIVGFLVPVIAIIVMVVLPRTDRAR